MSFRGTDLYCDHPSCLASFVGFGDRRLANTVAKQRGWAHWLDGRVDRHHCPVHRASDPVVRFRDERRTDAATKSTSEAKSEALNSLTGLLLGRSAPAVFVRSVQDRATKADIREGNCPSFDEVA